MARPGCVTERPKPVTMRPVILTEPQAIAPRATGGGWQTKALRPHWDALSLRIIAPRPSTTAGLQLRIAPRPQRIVKMRAWRRGRATLPPSYVIETPNPVTTRPLSSTELQAIAPRATAGERQTRAHGPTRVVPMPRTAESEPSTTAR